jgi:hypothetical protein
VTDLTAFLFGRLHEEEAALRALLGADAVASPQALAGWPRPERMLAALAGTRRVLRLHRRLWPDEAGPHCLVCGDPALQLTRAPWPCQTVLEIAQQFVDDPEFDVSWISSDNGHVPRQGMSRPPS